VVQRTLLTKSGSPNSGILGIVDATRLENLALTLSPHPWLLQHVLLLWTLCSDARHRSRSRLLQLLVNRKAAGLADDMPAAEPLLPEDLNLWQNLIKALSLVAEVNKDLISRRRLILRNHITCSNLH
jgi:hypothetical protein